MQFFSAWVSPTSTTKRFFTIGWTTVQRASRMLMPVSANVRERSSSRRVRSQASIWSSARNDGRGVPLPGDRGEALGVPHQRARVRAVLVVDRDALAERDVADDRVARDRPAALGEPQHHVVDPLDLDAVGGASAAVGFGASLRSSSSRRGVRLLDRRLALACSRCITLLVTTFAEIFAWPSAM